MYHYDEDLAQINLYLHFPYVIVSIGIIASGMRENLVISGDGAAIFEFFTLHISSKFVYRYFYPAFVVLKQ